MATRTVFGPNTMEAGNMTEWSNATGVTASTTGAITGTYSARGGAGAAADGNADENFFSADEGGRCDRLLLKCNYRPRSTPSGGDPVILSYGVSGTIAFPLYRDDADGKLYVVNTSNKWSTAPTNGTAYALEMELTFDGRGSPSMIRVWVDGTLVITYIEPTTTVIQIEQCRCLFVSGGKTTWDEVIDDVQLWHIDSWG